MSILRLIRLLTHQDPLPLQNNNNKKNPKVHTFLFLLLTKGVNPDLAGHAIQKVTTKNSLFASMTEDIKRSSKSATLNCILPGDLLAYVLCGKGSR